jgi:hypothetical protein
MSSFTKIQGKGHVSKTKKSVKARRMDHNHSAASASKRMVSIKSLPPGTFVPGRGNIIDVYDDEADDYVSGDDGSLSPPPGDYSSDDELRDANEQLLDHLRIPDTVPQKFDSPAKMQAFIAHQKDVIRSLVARNREIDAANRKLVGRPGQSLTVAALHHILFPPQFYTDNWGHGARPMCTAMKVNDVGGLVCYLDYVSAQLSIHAPIAVGRWCYGCMVVVNKFQTQRQGSFPIPRRPYENLMADMVQAARFVLAPTVRATCAVPNYPFCPSSAYYVQFNNYPWSQRDNNIIKQLRRGHSWMSQTGITGRDPAMDALIVGNIRDNFPLESQRARDQYSQASWADMAATEDAEPAAAPIWVKTTTVRMEGEKALIPYQPPNKSASRHKAYRKNVRRQNEPPAPPAPSPSGGLKGGMMDGDGQPELPTLRWQCGRAAPPDYRSENYLPTWSVQHPGFRHGLQISCARCDKRLAGVHDGKLHTTGLMCAHSECWGWLVECCVFTHSPEWGFDATEYLRSAMISPTQGAQLFSAWSDRFPVCKGMSTKPGMKEGVEEHPGPLFIQDWLSLGSYVTRTVAPSVSKVLGAAETLLRSWRAVDDYRGRVDHFISNPAAGLVSCLLEVDWIYRNPTIAAASYAAGIFNNIALPLVREIATNDPSPVNQMSLRVMNFTRDFTYWRNSHTMYTASDVVLLAAHTWERAQDLLAQLPAPPDISRLSSMILPTTPSSRLHASMMRIMRPQPAQFLDHLQSITPMLLIREWLSHWSVARAYVSVCVWGEEVINYVGGFSGYLQRAWARLMHALNGNIVPDPRDKKKRSRQQQHKSRPKIEVKDVVVERKIKKLEMNFEICRTILETGFCEVCSNKWASSFNPQLAIQHMRAAIAFYGYSDPFAPVGNYIARACLYLSQEESIAPVVQALGVTLRAAALPSDYESPPLREENDGPFVFGNHRLFNHTLHEDAPSAPKPAKERLADLITNQQLEIQPPSLLTPSGIVPGCRLELGLTPAPKFVLDNDDVDYVVIDPTNWKQWAAEPRAHPAIRAALAEHWDELLDYDGRGLLGHFLTHNVPTLLIASWFDPDAAYDLWARALKGPRFVVECRRFVDSDVTLVHPNDYLRRVTQPVAVENPDHLTTPVRRAFELLFGKARTFTMPEQPPVRVIAQPATPIARRHRLPRRNQTEPHPSNIFDASVHHLAMYCGGRLVESVFHVPEVTYQLSPNDYNRVPETYETAWSRLDNQFGVFSYPPEWRPLICRSHRFYHILAAAQRHEFVTPPIEQITVESIAFVIVCVLITVRLVLHYRRSRRGRPTIAAGIEPNPGP